MMLTALGELPRWRRHGMLARVVVDDRVMTLLALVMAGIPYCRRGVDGDGVGGGGCDDLSVISHTALGLRLRAAAATLPYYLAPACACLPGGALLAPRHYAKQRAAKRKPLQPYHYRSCPAFTQPRFAPLPACLQTQLLRAAPVPLPRTYRLLAYVS